MKTSRFSDTQIIAILKQAEVGSPVPDFCREHGFMYYHFLPVALQIRGNGCVPYGLPQGRDHRRGHGKNGDAICPQGDDHQCRHSPRLPDIWGE